MISALSDVRLEVSIGAKVFRESVLDKAFREGLSARGGRSRSLDNGKQPVMRSWGQSFRCRENRRYMCFHVGVHLACWRNRRGTVVTVSSGERVRAGKAGERGPEGSGGRLGYYR